MKHYAVRFATLLVAVVAVGCGGVERGDVTGKVLYKGKPVICGSVTFWGRDRIPVTGGISPDGTYSVKDTLTGDNQIGVISFDPNYADKEAFKGVNLKDWSPIPVEFQNPASSGLSFNVQKGANTFDIELNESPPGK